MYSRTFHSSKVGLPWCLDIQYLEIEACVNQSVAIAPGDMPPPCVCVLQTVLQSVGRFNDPNVCSEWDIGAHIALVLEGKALRVLLDLRYIERQDYWMLVAALEQHFGQQVSTDNMQRARGRDPGYLSSRHAASIHIEATPTLR